MEWSSAYTDSPFTRSSYVGVFLLDDKQLPTRRAVHGKVLFPQCVRRAEKRPAELAAQKAEVTSDKWSYYYPLFQDEGDISSYSILYICSNSGYPIMTSVML
jgi:hypothetical protein